MNLEICSKIVNKFVRASENLEYYITQGLFNELIVKIKNTQNLNKKNCINSFDLETALE